MGANLCNLNHRSCTGEDDDHMKSDQAAASFHDGNNIISNTIKLKLKCWTGKEKKESSPEKENYKQRRLIGKMGLMKINSEKLSLEELFLASPRATKADFVNGGGGGGQFHVLRNYSFKRKVHPSSSFMIKLLPTIVSSSSCDDQTQRRVVEENHECSDQVSGRSRNQNGKNKKKKKKVSFKLPEESDFIVFYSPRDSSADAKFNVPS